MCPRSLLLCTRGRQAPQRALLGSPTSPTPTFTSFAPPYSLVHIYVRPPRYFSPLPSLSSPVTPVQPSVVPPSCHLVHRLRLLSVSGARGACLLELLLYCRERLIKIGLVIHGIEQPVPFLKFFREHGVEGMESRRVSYSSSTVGLCSLLCIVICSFLFLSLSMSYAALVADMARRHPLFRGLWLLRVSTWSKWCYQIMSSRSRPGHPQAAPFVET